MGGAGQEAAPAGEAEDERTLAKALTEIVIRLDLSEEASMRLPTPVIAFCRTGKPSPR
ncbi:hypothetical protein [Nonomuraea sp. NPDC050540]|uniref:hypothetical protein n=1 Tax=Nonomuraea sp. NPDC050540 TaxID=3364367 RepID=UPI00379E04C8